MKTLPDGMLKINGIKRPISIDGWNNGENPGSISVRDHRMADGYGILSFIVIVAAGFMTGKWLSSEIAGLLASICTTCCMIAFSIVQQRRWVRMHPVGRTSAVLRAEVEQFMRALRAYARSIQEYQAVHTLVERGLSAPPEHADAFYDLLERAHATLTRRFITLEELTRQNRQDDTSNQPGLVEAVAALDHSFDGTPEVRLDATFRDEHAMDTLEHELAHRQSLAAPAKQAS